jgi:A/G-specific adenine glycosylase
MKIDIPPRSIAPLRRALLAWFGKHRRALPWRASRDPYRVWIAEIMLQQTRIAAVIPYYGRFLEHFPTVNALADAREDAVLRQWSGLGYYSRARNLHKAAKEIVATHGGVFPQTHEAALALPGIGHYTAAAVLSIAYDVPLAVLDGNVARVLARLGAVKGDIREPKRWQALSKTAQALLAPAEAGDWNQALMELGEIVCMPRSPRCEICPISKFCRARALGLTEEIPAPRKKRAPVSVRIAAAILRDKQGRVLLVKDPGAHDGVLFSRMWQFPAIEVVQDTAKELGAHLQQSLGVKIGALHELPTAKHGVTFRNIVLLPFLAEVSTLPKALRTKAIALADLDRLPVSSATRKIAHALRNSQPQLLADSRPGSGPAPKAAKTGASIK